MSGNQDFKSQVKTKARSNATMSNTLAMPAFARAAVAARARAPPEAGDTDFARAVPETTGFTPDEGESELWF